jgi:hypothetical protein
VRFLTTLSCIPILWRNAIFLFSRELGALLPGVKRPEREADLSHPSIAEVKYAWSSSSTLPYASMAFYLITHLGKSLSTNMNFVMTKIKRLKQVNMKNETCRCL